MKIKSVAQAGFLGAVAGGAAKGNPGLTPAKARKMLRENRGVKLAALPARVAPRVSRRGGR